ncbi:MAG: Mu transposase C-terminal domain-containing protein [Proteobacteria bacterium]|nr:Mu transposase C-terminal domain-containing protein [Pseudomonadota bacterium]
MKRQYSATELLALNIQGMPPTKRQINRLAADEGWRYVTVIGLGGSRREYPIDQPALALVAAHLAAQSPASAPAPQALAEQPRPALIAPSNQAEADLTAEQRAQLTGRRIVLAHVKNLAATRGLALSAACQAVLDEAAAGLASADLVTMLRQARSPRGRPSPNGLPSARALQAWLSQQSSGRSIAPSATGPDLAVQPWHALAIELRQRPQGSTLVWLHEQLLTHWQTPWGRAPSYATVARFFREQFSQTDQLKGRHTGSALRALTFYQHRSSAGMRPFQEVHADGWTTHFTAPHPVTGEYVTYEVWHYHDVATRYLTPLSIGLTENTDVILAGLRACVEFGGVPAIWQTDSTRSVKNARVEGDLQASLAQRLGISIVHPQTVGNSQANGIAENFNTWLDKEARSLATYQHPARMDSATFTKVRRLTGAMVKAGPGTPERERQRQQAIRLGKGIVFDTHTEAITWLRALEDRWNDRPHRSLPKVRCPLTGRMVHQTPRQALEAARAGGWQPVALSQAELIDAFLPHLRKKVRRGTVTPYNGQRYHHPDLAHHEGCEVIVAVDERDPSQIWVKDLQGRLLCIAAFVEATGYRTASMAEHAERKRAEAQIRRRENQIAAIEARLAPPPIDVVAIEHRSPDVIEWPAAAQPAHAVPLQAAEPDDDDAQDPVAMYLSRRLIEREREDAERRLADLTAIESAMKKAAAQAAAEEGEGVDPPRFFNQAVG